MTPAEFAQLATDHLRARGMTREIRYDTVRFALVVEGEHGIWRFCFLGHAHHEWEAAPAAEQEKVLQRRLWSLVDNGKVPPKEEVLKAVLLRLREPLYHAVIDKQVAAQVDDEVDQAKLRVPRRPFNDELDVNPVFDLPTSAMDVTQVRLDLWKMSLAELEVIALENLRLRSQAPFRPLAPGLWASGWGDGFDASRLLLDELVKPLKVKGEQVAMMPAATVLMIAGSEDDEALSAMAEIARDAVQDPRALTGVAFKRSADGWHPWLPASNRPPFDRMYFLALQSKANLYTQQKELLDAWHEHLGHDRFVARFSAYRTDGGEIYTSTPWTAGVDGLLPRTDRIDFVQHLGADDDQPQVWPAKFEVALEKVGRLMVRTDDRPERWAVTGFPTEAELAEMTQASGLKVSLVDGRAGETGDDEGDGDGDAEDRGE